MSDAMLTTTDNPYDPFIQFDEWLAFDTEKGYNTLNYLGRIAVLSDEQSEADQELAIDMAMDEIVEYNLLGIYKKVVKDD